MEFHTNSYKATSEGFSSHYWERIGAIIYAKTVNKTFLYTPLQGVAHNYTNDKEFLEKKEQLMNLIDAYPVNRDFEFQKRCPESCMFFFNNVAYCCGSEEFARIKSLFYLNKKREDYFSNDCKHIAVHIRKRNPHDLEAPTELSDGRYTSIIQKLRSAFSLDKIRFHIYSQGPLNKFQQIWKEDDIQLHINASIEDTFTSMVFADVLVTCQSAFSRLAGYLSNGLVIYPMEAASPQNLLPHFRVI